MDYPKEIKLIKRYIRQIKRQKKDIERVRDESPEMFDKIIVDIEQTIAELNYVIELLEKAELEDTTSLTH